ncbi:MAG: SIMPL domain-containing protein [Pseudomonadota bacterium]
MQFTNRSRLVKQGLLALFAASVPSWGVAQNIDNAGIHVSGAGEVLIVPDIATISFEIKKIGNVAAAMKSELDEISAAVMKVARSAGVAEKDISATSVLMVPNTRYNKGNSQSIDGVIATRSMTIIVRDLTSLADITNGALDAGINTISQIQLDTTERANLEDRALDLAVADARRLGKRLADGFGVELGSAFNVRAIGRHSARPEIARTTLLKSGDDSYSTGEMTIRREVEVSFSILGNARQ